MQAWVEISQETRNNLKLHYSIGWGNPRCDGVILYNQRTRAFSLVELAVGATLTDTQYFVEGMRGRMQQLAFWQKHIEQYTTFYPVAKLQAFTVFAP